MGGHYGIDGFHKGFGELLGNLLMKNIHHEHDNRPKPIVLAGRLL